MADYTVELYLGATLGWVNINQWVDNSVGITIAPYGRQNWQTSTEAGVCNLALEDDLPPSGRWAPDNPLGPWYGLIGRNTPLRVKVTYGASTYDRFAGEVTRWAPTWDPSGAMVTVPVEAAGILRRLEQWRDPVQSVLRRQIPAVFADLVAYWPLEDTPARRRPAAGLDTHDPMRVSGKPEFAGYDGFEASKPIMVLRDADLTGAVPWYSYTSGSAVWQVGFPLHVGESGSTNGQTILHVNTSEQAARWEIQYLTEQGGALRLRVVDENETQQLLTTARQTGINGQDLLIQLRATRTATDIDWNLHSLTPDGQTQAFAGSVGSNLSLGRATRVRLNAFGGHDDVAIGHVFVLKAAKNFLDLVDVIAAYELETAGRRIERLCAEHGVPFTSVGDLDATDPMGPQLVDTFGNLVAESAAADHGQLFEPRVVSVDTLALGFRTLGSMVAQAAAVPAVYTSQHLSEPLEPVPDHLDVHNDVTVSGPRGEGRAQLLSGRLSVQKPPAGVGRYEFQTAVNVPEAHMDAHARWLLAHGTAEGTRYPQVTFDLTNPNIDATLRDKILTARQGDRLTIDALPLWVSPDPASLLIEGVASETITPFRHQLVFNCSPYAPYQAGIFDNAASRFDSAISTSSAAFVAGTDTQLVVATPTGPRWTQDPTEFPFNVASSGAKLAVTGIGSGFKDTFARTVANGWGTATGGAGVWTWENEGGTASDYNVPGTGVATVEDDEAGGATRRVFLPLSYCQAHNLVDLEALWSVSIPVLATGTEGPQASMIVREDGTNNNFYVFRVIFGLSANIQIRISIRQAGVETTLHDPTGSQATYAAGTVIHVRNRIVGNQLMMRVWAGANAEPEEWQSYAQDSTFTQVGRVGLRSSADLGFTGTLPLVFTWSQFDIVQPQRFTITQTPVNGISKTIPAGSPVNLADPVRFGL